LRFRRKVMLPHLSSFISSYTPSTMFCAILNRG